MPITATGRLLIVTLGVAGGILAADQMPPLLDFAPGVLYGVALVSLIAAGLTGAKHARRAASNTALVPLLCAALCFGCVGAARTVQTQKPALDDVSQLADGPSVWVRVRVEGWAETDETGRQSFTGRVERVYDFKRAAMASGQVRVAAPASIDARPGAVLWLRGRVTRPRGATNPGAFDYARFLARQGTFALFAVRHSDDAQSGGTARATLTEQAALWVRAGIHRAVATYLHGDDAALMNGLLLSDRAGLPANFTDDLQRVGMVHILSVSGLHVAALGWAVTLILRGMRVPRGPRAGLALIVLWLFVLASGCAPASVRSGIMASLFLLAPLARRVPNAPHTLIVAALLLLLWQPGCLWDAGFQLSIATVGTLVLYGPILRQWLLPSDSAQAMTLPPLLQRARRASEWVLLGVLTGLVAEAGSGLLVAYHFNLVSPVGPFANLGVVLAELLTLAGLALSGIQGLPHGLLSPLWQAVAFLLHGLQGWVGAWAALPFAGFAVPSPPALILFAYYALLPIGAIYLRRHVFNTTLFAPLPVSPAAANPHAGLPAT